MAANNRNRPKPAALLTGIDDNIAACRAWGHDWPSRKLVPGKPLPRGFRPAAQRDGTVLVTEICPRCSKKRFTETLRGGLFDRAAVRRYENPYNWKVIAQDKRVTPRDFQTEVWRRMLEDIVAAANRNQAAAGEDSSQASDDNGVRFQAPVAQDSRQP